MASPLDYVIDLDSPQGRPGRIVEGGFDCNADVPGAAETWFYVNYLDQHKQRIYDYLPRTGTAAEYGEDILDPARPGFEANIREQLDRRPRNRVIEGDNPDSYRRQDVERAHTLIASYQHRIALKNPHLRFTDGGQISALLSRPEVVAAIVEEDNDATANTLDMMRRLASKPDLPVYFVSFGDGRAWAERIAAEIRANDYRNMSVTFDASPEEYGGNVIDVQLPLGAATPLPPIGPIVMPTMLILRGIANDDHPRGQLDDASALEYARRRGYVGRVLDIAGSTAGAASDRPQVQQAIAAFRADPNIKAFYGFSGGGYNLRPILNALTPTEKSRIDLVAVLGSPPVGNDRQPTKESFEGPWELVYRLDPPAGHMAGPAALLAETVSPNTTRPPMAWRVAKSLEILRDQVNAKWPGRDKSNDGTIGDASHAATNSDHNPNEAGVVTAMDVTHDPAHGLDARKLAEMLVASRDPRIKYIISNAQIISSTVSAWTWRPYNGANAHREHVHISVMGEARLYDDQRPWVLEGVAVVMPPPPIITKPSKQFETCVAMLLKDEGGNDDDPDDPGGRTSRGILQREWDAWRLSHPGLPSDVWQAPQDQVIAIYRQLYWDALSCDKLPAGVDYAVFDFGVNSGINRSAKMLQGIVGADVDGDIGPLTIAATAQADAATVINRMCDERIAYLRGLPIWWKYGNGWTARVNGVRTNAAAMVGSKPIPGTQPPPVTPGPPAAAGNQVMLLLLLIMLSNLKEKQMPTDPTNPAQPIDIGGVLLPLLLQSMLSGKPLNANDILPALLQALTGQPLALPPPVTPPTPPPVTPPAQGQPTNILEMLLPFLLQTLTGKPAVTPPPTSTSPAAPVPPAPATSPGWLNLQGGIAGLMTSLGLSATGIIGTPIGPDSTVTGMLLPIISMGAAALGVPAWAVQIFSSLWSRLRAPAAKA